MIRFRPNFIHKLLLGLMLCLLPALTNARTPIFGNPEIEVDHMYAYVKRHNPEFSREVAEAFHYIGRRYGIRGDIALCQAIIETGWFRFDNGTAVRPEAHNYCGLGVKKRGDEGCSFKSVEEGVTAMIQHLYAYACSDKLPAGESMIDPRFNYVSRGCASTWEKLAGRWAMNPNYGNNIMRIYAGLEAKARSGTKIQFIEVSIPDALLAEDEIDFSDLDYAHDVENPSVAIDDEDLFN